MKFYFSCTNPINTQKIRYKANVDLSFRLNLLMSGGNKKVTNT